MARSTRPLQRARVSFPSICRSKTWPNLPDWPYKGWPDEKRMEFLLSLATIIGKRTQFGLIAFFNKRDYNDIFPDWWKNLGTTPYTFCIQLFFQALVEELKKRWRPEVDTQVTFIFDQN